MFTCLLKCHCNRPGAWLLCLLRTLCSSDHVQTVKDHARKIFAQFVLCLKVDDHGQRDTKSWPIKATRDDRIDQFSFLGLTQKTPGKVLFYFPTTKKGVRFLLMVESETVENWRPLGGVATPGAFQDGHCSRVMICLSAGEWGAHFYARLSHPDADMFSRENVLGLKF